MISFSILGNDIAFNVAFSECDCGYVEECPWSWENMLQYLGIKGQDDAANFQMVQGGKCTHRQGEIEVREMI